MCAHSIIRWFVERSRLRQSLAISGCFLQSYVLEDVPWSTRKSRARKHVSRLCTFFRPVHPVEGTPVAEGTPQATRTRHLNPYLNPRVHCPNYNSRNNQKQQRLDPTRPLNYPPCPSLLCSPLFFLFSFFFPFFFLVFFRQVKNRKYGQTDSFEGENFPSDVFLVFGNRLLAMLVAAAMVTLPLRSEPAGGWAPQVTK